MRNGANRIEVPETGVHAETAIERPQGMILVIADDPATRRAARMGLVKQGLEVGEADSDDKAILRMKMIDFDIVLVDADGRGAALLSLIRRIREVNHAVLIFLQGSEIDEERQIRALNAGMNDFLLKPVNPRLLAAKAAAVMRFSRSRQAFLDGPMAFGDIVLDPARYVVTKKGVPIHVTVQEFKVLKLLMENPGKLLGYARFCECVWGDTSDDLRTRLRVLINNLRKKLETRPSQPKYIQNEMRLGYRFTGERKVPSRRNALE
jgi:two-component system KDP operon response regulator KdpE